MNPPEISITPIGNIELGIDGRDEYLLLTRKDDEMDETTAREWLLPQVYRESMRPGGYFCVNVTIMRRPYRENECVAIVHHRFDV